MNNIYPSYNYIVLIKKNLLCPILFSLILYNFIQYNFQHWTLIFCVLYEICILYSVTRGVTRQPPFRRPGILKQANIADFKKLNHNKYTPGILEKKSPSIYI